MNKKDLEAGNIYSMRVNYKTIKIRYVGYFYGLKTNVFNSDIQAQEIKSKEFEFTLYPGYVFYSKETGPLYFSSLKQLSDAKLVKKGKVISIDTINEEILKYSINNTKHKVCNTIIWKSILMFTKSKDDVNITAILEKLKENNISIG